jgi:tRNA-Thr(GGU) m(6)t(6)A37 methyltransferase TsaA
MKTTRDLLTIGHIRRDGGVRLEVDEPYRAGLAQLEQFDHAIVLWWVDGHDNDESRSILQTELPYAPGVTAGVFACRSEYRPNPIAVTVCRIDKVEEAVGLVWLGDIDAIEGSPLLDIKPYIPVVDRVRNPRVASWLDGWPSWLPPEGIGLYDD